jgi:hypothetical protein
MGLTDVARKKKGGARRPTVEELLPSKRRRCYRGAYCQAPHGLMLAKMCAAETMLSLLEDYPILSRVVV